MLKVFYRSHLRDRENSDRLFHEKMVSDDNWMFLSSANWLFFLRCNVHLVSTVWLLQ